MHCQMILDEYRERRPLFEKLKTVVLKVIEKLLEENGLEVTVLNARVKTEKSLAGKLELKGKKYLTLDDITDILGLRIVTFYTDDVDKIAALAERVFEVDWNNSVDKRKMLDLDRFGYASLHYVCRLPASVYHDDNCPELNEVSFELQMRTALQHVWATMHHDTGYKSPSGVDVPMEHLRNFNRLAGLLELADEQFARIRSEIVEYRRQVLSLVADGNFDAVGLNGETFRSYLEVKPFKPLIERIAAVNQAEVYYDSLLSYLDVLHFLNFKTLGDIERMKKDFSNDAYQLAVHQLAGTDLDIVAQSLALQNLCIIFIYKQGGREHEMQKFFELVNGVNGYNATRAHDIVNQVTKVLH